MRSRKLLTIYKCLNDFCRKTAKYEKKIAESDECESQPDLMLGKDSYKANCGKGDG